MGIEPTYRPDRLLQDAARHGELVIFVGAGASMLCGSPDWRGFANQVVRTLEENRALSFLEAEQLRALGDPRRTLSIALSLAEEQGVTIDFDAILHPHPASPSGARLYELLSALRPVFVTTNYDKWLDDAGPSALSAEMTLGKETAPADGPIKRARYFRREHLSPALLAERGAVIHLHGSYEEPASMVVSLRDYIEHYADEKVQAFLSAMFKNYTVLFIGYGLAELEILDHIIRSNPNVSESRHCLLYAHRSTESVQTRFIEQFFQDQCGVRVIPYCIDGLGYQELVEVVKEWSSELDVREASTLDLQAHLDRYIASSGTESRRAAFRLIDRHPELSAYLVNSLKEPIWFDELDAEGFFDPSHSPGVKVRTDSRGTTYQAEGWPALRFLEHVGGMLTESQARRVMEIVREITVHAKARGIDNWRTWWSLATILSQLPLHLITDADIQMAGHWLRGAFESNMVGSELGSKLLPRLISSSESADWDKALKLVDALTMSRAGDNHE